MTEQPALTPEAATTERAFLMTDKTFTEAAMNPAGREFARLTALNHAIAGTTPESLAEPEETTPGDPQAPPTFEAAASPESYDFEAAWSGVELPPEQATELRQCLYTAGIDPEFAATAYMAAAQAESRQPTDEQITQECESAARHLQGVWGAAYEEKLALATEEGKRLFALLPASVKAGRDWQTFIVDTGIGRSASVIKRLAERALVRSGAGAA